MTRVSPHSPRRQRKALYTADSFERRRRMSVLLSRELRARFHRRSVPVRKGDTVRVLAGSFVGREERVAKIDRRAYAVTLDNVTLKTADEKLKPLGLRPGRLVITRLNLSDPWRRRSLRVREEDLSPEERGVTPEEEETPEIASTPVEPPAPPVEQAPTAPPADEATPDPEKPGPLPRPRRRPKTEPAEEGA
jgi:ribosomal protein uL24